MKPIILFCKSDISGYTKKDGTVVKPHSDRRVKKPLPPKAHLDQMESSLANDEESSDDELHDFFTKECGIHPDHSRAAIKHRPKFNATAIPPAGMLRDLMSKDQ